jgi:hypothetical protein
MSGGGGGSSSTTYYYKLRFPHTSIDASQPILLYNAYGDLVETLPPYSEYMDYSNGVFTAPGTSQNTTIESISTATYYVFYSTGDLTIDYDKAEIKIAKPVIRTPADSTVSATYEYVTAYTPIVNIFSVIDGKWDTQVQTVFYSEPPRGYRYGIMDLGSVRNIQTIDIVGGFYKPDEDRRYDVSMNFTLKHSLDGVNFEFISSAATNFEVTGGSSKSIEEKDLGISFQTRYLLLEVDKIKKLEYSSVKASDGTILQSGLWAIALTEVMAYSDIIIKSEAMLIPAFETTSTTSIGANHVDVVSTEGFELESGETERTVYILNADGTYDDFTYTGITPTMFTGVTNVTQSHATGSLVVRELEGDSTLYDHFGLLPKLGDRFYKGDKSSDSTLYSKAQLDYLSKMYLREFCKNHSKVNVEVLYSPHLQVGQTIKIVDAYNNVNDNYFIEAIAESSGFFTVTLARYP